MPVVKAGSSESKESVVVASVPARNSLTTFPNNNRTRKIFEQRRLIEEGSDLVEQRRYDEAIMKYQEAMKLELLLHDYDVYEPILLIATVLKFQGKYGEALQRIDRVLEKYPNATADPQRDEKRELEALIKARDADSLEPIYGHIRYLREKYLSPKGFRGDADRAISAIIRLCDHIGDYDQGVAFANEIMAHGLRKSKHLLSQVKTAQEAWEISQELRRNHDEKWRGYKFAYEYLRIREAFLEDKLRGTKGRATQALIQSDYFPW